MKKLMMILFSFVVLQGTAKAGDDLPITTAQLPVNAQQFIKTHFAKSEVSYAKMERDWLEKKYDVVFTDGNKVEFDGKGNWTDIDCKYNSVPETLIPQAIKNYVTRNHANTRIVQLERDRKYFEVELSNGVELKFNKQFKLVKIER